MKRYVFILCLIFGSVFSQNDSVYKHVNSGTISVEKMNIVYRGINNPLSISVSNAKSFTAEGKGLQYKDGKYFLLPGSGIESKITLKIIKNDATEITEEHVFRIKNLPRFIGTIDGQNCYDCIVKMTKKELEEAIISTSADNFPIDLNLKVKKFSVKFDKKPPLSCEGNIFNKQVISEINNARIGSTFVIYQIDYRVNHDGCVAALAPIQIQIVKEEIPYFETKEFKKDSLTNLRRLRKESRKALRL